MNACPGRQTMQQLLEGTLSDLEAQEISAHLETCARCQELYEQLASPAHAALATPRDPLSQEAALQRMMHQLQLEGPVTERAASGAAAAGARRHSGDGLDFLTPVDDENLLGLLGSYEVLEVVGRGGMGVVLKARDPRLNRFVAVKVLAPHLAQSGAARQRFCREAQAAAAVSHDHVVTIHSVEEADGLPILVMEFVSGVSLQQRIDRDGPLELRKILRISLQAAAGLAAAHAQGLIHRDIKPGNILLENGVERVKLTDFGLARAADDLVLTQTGFLAGTPLYMSPEQAQGRLLDARSDLFSLGSVMYTMCTGRPAFRAETPYGVIHRVCHDQPRSIVDINPDIPDWLIEIIGRLMSKQPDYRYQSAAEVAQLLSRHLTALQQPSAADQLPTVSLPPPQPRKQAESIGNSERASTSASAARWMTGCLLALVLLIPLLAFGAMIGWYLSARSSHVAQPALVDAPIIEIEKALEADEATVVPLPLQLLKDHRLEVTAVAFAPSGSTVATGDQEGFVRIWDAETGEKREVFIQAHLPVAALSFSADGQYVVGALAESHVYVWQLDAAKLVARLDLSRRLIAEAQERLPQLIDQRSLSLQGKRLTALAVSPDGAQIAIGTHLGVAIWEWSSGERLMEIAAEQPQLEILDMPRTITSLAFSPTERVLAASDRLGTISAWRHTEDENDPWKSIAEFEAHRDMTWLAFSPDGTRLATVTRGRFADGGEGTGEGLVRLWNTADWDLLGTWGPVEPDYELTSPRFLPDSQTLLTGGAALTAWNLAEPSMVRMLLAKPLKHVAISGDGRFVAAAGQDLAVQIWELQSLMSPVPADTP